MHPPPRYATPRRSDRATIGPQTAGIARGLGTPLLPWQAHVADVAGELDEHGRLAYRTIVLSVPRRAGKSLLVLAAMLNRSLRHPGSRVWYTAQDGSSVTKTWRQEWAPIIARSPFDPHVRARMSQGREEFELARTGSFISAFAPTPTALHGQNGDVIVFDEAWAHSADRGRELRHAAGPVQATRRNPQIWIVSAAGDIDSTWWLDWIDIGRSAAAADIGHGVAFLEWSADAPGLDLDDPDVWAASHPAVRSAVNPHGTIDLEFLADERTADLDVFRRAYLNITDRVGTGAAPIDLETWRRLATDPPDRGDGITIGVDCSPDQVSTSLVASLGVDAPVLELIDHRPGHGWAVDRIAELIDAWPVAAVVIDPGSPAGALLPDLRRLAVPLIDVQLRDVTAAAAGLVEAVRTGTVRHVAHPLIDDAIQSARRRPIGDGSWTFDRKRSTVDVSPLIAAMLARYGHPTVAGAVPAVS